ncbi:protein of unknown function [Formosa sp. Hel1_31_208]|uniref:DUF4296 domain-containing protein n=1 Tax=Formosa sp. Hel1_31_208 TaxID=1798225 RepID=UPI0008792657|nr:DUF4296 domain-containing protein [Formosa sp. Hel1_31_208]SDR83969.1 protein of unknown function [Formosa sp. Hel1_31_208]
MRTTIFILTTLFLFGCNSIEKPEKPENLLSKDKMVDILYDIYILNAAKGATKTVLVDNGIFPQDYVFEKHKIDSLQFAKSNEYYGYYVEEYESILGQLEQKISRDKDKYQLQIDKELIERERNKDSIKTLSDTLKVKKKSKKIKKVDYKDYPSDRSKSSK